MGWQTQVGLSGSKNWCWHKQTWLSYNHSHDYRWLWEAWPSSELTNEIATCGQP